MSISALKMDSKRLKSFFERYDAIEILFYLTILTFYVGKVYNVFIFLLDIVFLYRVLKGRVELKDYKEIVVAISLFSGYLIIQALFFVEHPMEVLKNALFEIMYLLMIPAALATFKHFEQLKRLVFVSWVAVATVSLDGLYQYFTGYDIFGFPKTSYGSRLTAWREGRSILGPMLPLFSGILLAAPLLLKEKKLRVIGVAIAILLFVVVVLSGNRSPLLALLSALILIALISRYRKIIFFILIGFVAIFFLTMHFNKELSPKYRALLHPTSNAATANRYHIFLTGWEMIKDNPFFGIGPGSYDKLHLRYTKKVDWSKYKEYQVKSFMHRAPSHVHSVLIDMILSYGIVGFLFLLYMFYTFFKHLILRSEVTKIAAIGFFYAISPVAFSKAFTVDRWQFLTYLALVFVAVIANIEKRESNVTN